MAVYNRKELIVEFMRSKNSFVTVDELCKHLYVSGATIRRDLKEMEESQLIRRTRGGAILLEGSTSEDPLYFRENQNAMQKQIIAGMATKHIKDGMTLFLDSSSTVFILARQLEKFSGLKIITNGLKVSLLLSDFKNISLLCTGGRLRENSKSLVGQAAVSYLTRFNADIAFMSCRGFSLENGISEANEDEYYIKRAFLQHSKKHILLCDTSKMGEDYLCRTAPIHDFHEIITERKDVNDRCKEIRAKWLAGDEQNVNQDSSKVQNNKHR